MMKLYGSDTSPFVRRVRIVCAELGLDYERIDTQKDEGRQALHHVSPIWRVPALDTGSEILMESHTILEWLLRRDTGGRIRRPSDATHFTERTWLDVIDAAIDSAVNLRQLTMSGHNLDEVPYVKKQRSRIASACTWLDERLSAYTPDSHPSVFDIALVTTVEWMQFRNAYAIGGHTHLMRLAKHFRERPSFVNTRPPA